MSNLPSEPNIATRLDRLEHQLKIIQFATEHPDRNDFLLTTISYAIDLALDEVKAVRVQLNVN